MPIFTRDNTPTVNKSLKKIEELLLETGVSSFVKEYDEDNLTSLYFVTDDDVPVRLPLHIGVIEETLRVDHRQLDKAKKLELRDKAERIAVAELANFVEMICTMVRLKQTTLRESFLAFTYDKVKNKTFYEMLEAKGTKFLEDGN